MRKIHFFVMLSLDGFFEGPNHDLSWHNVDDEFNKFAIEQLNDTGLMIWGRRTYELMEAYWPKAEKSPETSRDDLEIARMINNTPKLVFSRTLKGVRQTENWKNVKLVHEFNPGEIEQLKQQPGKDIWVGMSDLATTFLKANLIDEFRFIINPVIVGEGTPLFKGLKERVSLELVKSRKFDSGNVLLYYSPAK